jgi:hypothetical protein
LPPRAIFDRKGDTFRIFLLVDLLSDGVRGICSAIAEYGIRVKDKAFSKD